MHTLRDINRGRVAPLKLRQDGRDGFVDDTGGTIYCARSAAFGGTLLAFSEGQLVAAHPIAPPDASISDTEACKILAGYFGSCSFLPTTSAPSSHQRAGREIEALLEKSSPISLSALRFYGSPFQHLVWRYLHSIPSGEARTYAEVARAIGRPKAIRAVANACAQNRLAFVIPCHRVIRSDGSLGGYRWGVDLKRAILTREGFTL